MIEIFDKLFNSLSEAEKDKLLLYIFKKHNLNEGYFSGPSAKIEKGLFTGPSNSVGTKICPTCRRPF